MHRFLLSALFILFSVLCFSQQLTLQQKLQTNIDIQDQFQSLLSQSRNLESDFKMVRRSNIEIIQRNVADSLAAYKKEITELKTSTSESSAIIISLRDSLDKVQAELNLETSKKDNINFVGIDFNKKTYHIFVWTIIIVLAITLLFISFSFRKAKVDAIEHQKTAEEVQDTFHAFKKKAMETEQKLKRQLLDEQLKNNS